jgi:DnaK suppressor protein
MQRVNEKLMKEIQETLKRIKDGNFGICQACGGDIEVERLREYPMETLCMPCRDELRMPRRRMVA